MKNPEILEGSTENSVVLKFRWFASDPQVKKIICLIKGMPVGFGPRFYEFSLNDNGQWIVDIEAPKALVSSYSIIPITDDMLPLLEAVAGPAAGFPDWLPLLKLAVPDPEAMYPPMAPMTSGVIWLPDAAPAPGWDEYWRESDYLVIADKSQIWQEIQYRRESEIGEVTRNLWLYQAENQTEDQGSDEAVDPYLLVLLDGDDWVKYTPLSAVLQQLVTTYQMPPIYALAVDSIDLAHRRPELLDNPTLVPEIANHIIPQLRERLGCAFPKERVILAGQSYGGWAAMHALLVFPEVFGNAIANSPSLWYPDRNGTQLGGELLGLLRQPENIALLAQFNPCIYSEIGSGEKGLARHFEVLGEELRRQSLPVFTATHCHGHEQAGWAGALTRGLVNILHSDARQ